MCRSSGDSVRCDDDGGGSSSVRSIVGGPLLWDCGGNMPGVFGGKEGVRGVLVAEERKVAVGGGAGGARVDARKVPVVDSVGDDVSNWGLQVAGEIRFSIIPCRPHSSRSLPSSRFHLPSVSSSAICACTSPSMLSSAPPSPPPPVPLPPPPSLLGFTGDGCEKPSIWKTQSSAFSRSASTMVPSRRRQRSAWRRVFVSRRFNDGGRLLFVACVVEFTGEVLWAAGR